MKNIIRCSWKKTFDNMSSKDKLIFHVVFNLICELGSYEKLDKIIDLSNKEKNIISFSNNPVLFNKPVSNNDLENLQKLINTNLVRHLEIIFSYQQKIETKYFASIGYIESLLLKVSTDTVFETGCFENLLMLKNFNINYQQNFDFKELRNLKNLTKLEINGHVLIDELNDISYLVNLEHLALNFIQFKYQHGALKFKEMERLKSLCFYSCNFELIDQETFSSLKNLVSLRFEKCGVKKIDAASFDQLEKLEYLNFDNWCGREFPIEYENINPPNLLYLQIYSYTVPKFKYLKNLRFLRIDRLLYIDRNAFFNLESLTGLVITTFVFIYDKFQIDDFRELKNLAYLKFIFETSNDKETYKMDVEKFQMKNFLNKENVYTHISDPKVSQTYTVSIYENFDRYIDTEPQIGRAHV